MPIKGRLTFGLILLYLSIIGLGTIVSLLVLNAWIPGVAVGGILATATVGIIRVHRGSSSETTHH